MLVECCQNRVPSYWLMYSFWQDGHNPVSFAPRRPLIVSRS